jgi:hypothetical protein
MSKATPIPDTIETRPGGIEQANCGLCGGRLTRAKAVGLWWHVITGRIICMESRDGDD